MPRGHPKGRRPGPCRHCNMVDDYRLARAADERAHEDGGFRDDAPRSGRPMITFRVWLQHFPWPRPEQLDGGPVAA